jgi:hypothetical protein
MENETTPPDPAQDPGSQPSESAPAPPPFAPDPALIGYLERAQKGAEQR